MGRRSFGTTTFRRSGFSVEPWLRTRCAANLQVFRLTVKHERTDSMAASQGSSRSSLHLISNGTGIDLLDGQMEQRQMNRGRTLRQRPRRLA